MISNSSPGKDIPKGAPKEIDPPRKEYAVLRQNVGSGDVT